MRTAGPDIYSVKTDGGKFNVVSFLPPEHVARKGIAPEAIVGVLPVGVVKITTEVFRPNPTFAEFLSEAIARHGPQAPKLQDEARRLGDGRLHVVDGRGFRAAVANPEEIFGAFDAKSGQVVVGSFQAEPRHALVNEHGLFVLDSWLLERLIEDLCHLGDTSG